jgi:hypothetical protein
MRFAFLANLWSDLPGFAPIRVIICFMRRKTFAGLGKDVAAWSK